jgi:uncharacterized protein (TIGR02145 family)
LLNLFIGDGNTSSNFEHIQWENGLSKWIRVDMDTTGGLNYSMMGTSQLLSVPFAFYAETSGSSSGNESVWTLNGSSIYYNSGNVGIGTNQPDASAALDISSTNKGFLPPRMTESERDMISNPQVGLMIYNLDTDCINVYKPGSWFALCGDCIPPPQPTLNSNSPACQGDTLRLFAQNAGGANCYWTGPSGFSSTDENPEIFPYEIQNSGTYTLVTNNDCGSSLPIAIDVEIAALPYNAGDISGSTNICQGSTGITFNIEPVENASSYTWTLPNGASISSGNNTNAITIDFSENAQSGNLIVTPANNCGEGDPSSPYFIQIIPLPDVADAGSDQINIEGTNTELEANNPTYGSGTWSIYSGTGGSLTNTNAFNSTFSGSTGIEYQLVWTINNSCGTTSDTVIISFAAEFVCGNILVDTRDGQTYNTVSIGSQCWMAENLNIGTMLNGGTAATDNTIIEKYCYSNLTSNCDIYGALYTWREMMQLPDNCETQDCSSLHGANHQGICPDGWHIPSDDEFKVLEMELGMTQTEADMLNTWRGDPVGTMLKEGGSSGFEGLLSGRMSTGGGFSLIENYEYPYTSDEYNSTYAFRRCVRDGDTTVGRWNTFPKSYGLSVRCLKNN